MKSNLLTSNDFMHNVKDYVLPIIVLIIIIALLIFFKRSCIKSAIQNLGGNKTSKSSRNIEHFQSSAGVKADLRTLNTKIHGNLFSGFVSRKESDKQLDKVKEIIAKNPEKYKMINPYRNNIFINGKESNKLKKVCLGNVENNCIDYDLMKKYDPNKHKIPIFLKGESKDPVYYNHDDTVVKHDKLCILDNADDDDDDATRLVPGTTANKYHCIEDKDLDIINGKIAVAFKRQISEGDKTYKKNLETAGITDTSNYPLAEFDDEKNGELIKSYNVEYGAFPGYNGVVNKTFYMTERHKKEIKDAFADGGSVGDQSSKFAGPKACFGKDGKTTHDITAPHGKARTYSGNYYINQQKPDITNYKHIHKHTDT